MSKKYTEEQKKAISDGYTKRFWTTKRQFRGLCIISIVTGLFLAGMLALVTVISDLGLSTVEIISFSISATTTLGLGIFGLVLRRSDNSLKRMGGVFRVAVNIGIIGNMLCVVAMMREASPYYIVPLFAVIALGGVLFFASVERNLLKNQDAQDLPE